MRSTALRVTSRPAGVTLSGGEERGVGGIAAFLAAMLLATIPLPPIVQTSIAGGNLNVTWTMVFVALGLANWCATRLMHGAAPRSGIYHAAVALLVFMIPPALYSSAGGSAYMAYINFAVGICAGLLVGRAWAASSLERTNVVDVGFYIFVLATTAQLVLRLQSAGSLAQFHQFADTTWGRSNYVAGALVTVAALLVVRSRLLRRRFFPLLVAAVGTIAALLTLSRGGAFAAAVFIASALWLMPRTPIAKFFGRALALSLPFAAWYAMDLIASQRYAASSQVDVNIDARFTLFGAAWQTFLTSPIGGSGWAGFRETTSGLAAQQTFAHNAFLSYLQIGGLLFGVTTLVVLVVTAVKAARKWPTVIPALMAIAAISMTDPFTEGTVGGMITWSTLAFAYLVHTNQKRTRALT